MFGNLEQSAPLGIIQVSGQFNLSIDSIEKTFFGVALHAIFRVNAEMLKTYGHASQIPLFTLCIQAHRHRRARAQRSKQKIVRRRSGVRPEGCGFVSAPSMFAGGNFLRQSGFIRNDYLCWSSHRRYLGNNFVG